jgi:hypothetical protein
MAARKHAPTQKSTAHDLTLTREKDNPRERYVLPLEPDIDFSFQGREHQVLISFNKYGEPLVLFIAVFARVRR